MRAHARAHVFAAQTQARPLRRGLSSRLSDVVEDGGSEDDGGSTGRYGGGASVAAGDGGSVSGDTYRRTGGSVEDLMSAAVQDTSISMEDLEIGETLGVGTFGRVRLVRHTPTGTYYALKSLRKDEVRGCAVPRARWPVGLRCFSRRCALLFISPPPPPLSFVHPATATPLLSFHAHPPNVHAHV